ncbi:MAG: glycosyltransferase family 2 protein [Bacteroidota bacterium]
MKLTIGILFHNESNHEIKRLMRSLIRQIDKNFSLIIIAEPRLGDIEIYKAFSRFKNLRFISNSFLQGTVNNRNRLIGECKTEYLVFVDGDDFVDRNFVKQINDSLFEKADLFYFNYLIKTKHSKQFIELSNKNIILETLQDWKILGCSVYKVEAIRRLNGYNQNGFEDVDLILRMISSGNDRFIFVPGTTYFWLKKDTGRNTQSTLLDTANLMFRNIEVYKKYNSKTQFTDKYFLVMLTFWRYKRFKEFIKLLIKAKLYFPLLSFVIKKIIIKRKNNA